MALRFSHRHRLILRAALLQGAEGEAAFDEWSHRIPLDHVDHDEFRLLPLVYHRARERGCHAAMMGRLKGVHRQVWVKNTLLLETCARAVGLLLAASIPTLLLKGIAIFAGRAGMSGSRAMRDVDILVPRGAARRAIDVLTRSGWVVKHFHMPDFADVDFESRHGITLCRDDGRELDLHWRALPRNTSPEHVEMFWSASQPIEVMGKTTKILRTEDQLYLSLTHGARHTDGASLDWVVDAFLLLRSQPNNIDWSRIMAHAHRDRSVPAIARQFRLFDEVLGISTPFMRTVKCRNWQLDVMASRILEKPYDFLHPRARLFLEYHEFLVRNAGQSRISTLVAFARRRFVVQRMLYVLPMGLIRYFGRPLNAAFGPDPSLMDEKRLPLVKSQLPWGAAQSPFLFGWSYPEPNGRWTIESQAILGFRDTSDQSNDLLATAEVRLYLTDRHQDLAVSVIVNGVPCNTWNFVSPVSVPARLTFIVPRAVRAGPIHLLLITFIIKSPARPSDVGQSQDVRKLGLFFERIRFSDHDEP